MTIEKRRVEVFTAACPVARCRPMISGTAVRRIKAGRRLPATGSRLFGCGGERPIAGLLPARTDHCGSCDRCRDQSVMIGGRDGREPA
jgi:hypothetical protein